MQNSLLYMHVCQRAHGGWHTCPRVHTHTQLLTACWMYVYLCNQTSQVKPKLRTLSPSQAMFAVQFHYLSHEPQGTCSNTLNMSQNHKQVS